MHTPPQPPLPGLAPAEPKHARRLNRLGAVLLVLLALPIAIYAVDWLYHLLVSQLDVVAPVILVPIAALVFALVGPWLFVHDEARVRRRLAGALNALWRAYARTPLAAALARRFPRLTSLIGRLFNASPMAGLLLIAVLLLASAVLWFFFVVLAQVVTGGSITGTDRRVITLVTTLRTPLADHVFYGITLLGTAETVIVVGSIAVLFTLLLGRYEDALLIVLAVSAGTGFFVLIKLLVQRPRPPLESAVYVQSGFSFPSGHSTVSAALYGTLAYLLVRGMRSETAKALIAITAALLVVAIGISRVYLGVHYPSDVLAGWAAGTFWVLLVIAAQDLWPSRPRTPLPRGWRTADVTVTVVLAVLGGAYLLYNDTHLPSPPVVSSPAPKPVAAGSVGALVENLFPHSTEGLTGAPQEPVSVVLIGSRPDLEAAFPAAGWTEAEPFGLGSSVQAFGAAVSGRPDAAAPVTPSFLGDEPNTLAFNLPEGTSFAQRHHIRLWQTTYVTADGRPIWEGTASFDEGFELAPDSGFPTHEIAPNIDAERTFVVSTLAAANEVTSLLTVQLVPPEQGHNFAGDPFVTDGQADILTLVAHGAASVRWPICCLPGSHPGAALG